MPLIYCNLAAALVGFFRLEGGRALKQAKYEAKWLNAEGQHTAQWYCDYIVSLRMLVKHALNVNKYDDKDGEEPSKRPGKLRRKKRE